MSVGPWNRRCKETRLAVRRNSDSCWSGGAALERTGSVMVVVIEWRAGHVICGGTTAVAVTSAWGRAERTAKQQPANQEQ